MDAAKIKEKEKVVMTTVTSSGGLRAIPVALLSGFAKIDLKRIFELLFNIWSVYYAPFALDRTFW